MVETQMVRLVVRMFPIIHKSFKGIGRVISIVGLPGVNVAKCVQRVCDPRFYDGKHGELGRSREALWRELVHHEFGVMETRMRHDDMEGLLCDFDNYDDINNHVFHLCSEVCSHTPNRFAVGCEFTGCLLHARLRFLCVFAPSVCRSREFATASRTL
jgi:hypothetical protein